MSSIGSILSAARTAIAAQQAAMQTASHNIANAQTPGFSRQRTDLVTRTPLYMPIGALGMGVDVANITRMRDVMLDAAYRDGAANADGSQLRHDLLSEIEGVFNEPSENGLSGAMDAFWNSWSDLANNPGNPATQGVVRQRGAQVVSLFNSFATRIDDLANRTRDRLAITVSDINGMTTRIAELNGRITAAESAGNQAPDLRDERDRIADQLAHLGVTRAEGQADGSLSIYVGGIAIVSGLTAKTLDVRASGTSTLVGVVGDPSPLAGLAGSLKAMTEFLNTDVPGIRSQLDALARGLVNGVNEYHASGWTAAGDALGSANWNPLAGPTGSRVNFFAATGTTAATIALSSEVLADPGVIASGDVQNAAGNNAVALAIGALRSDLGMDALRVRMGANFATQIGFASGVSYADHYRVTTSDLGLQVEDAAKQHDTFDAIASLADQRRQSVSGVSLDEELTRMMQYQQAYVAATRVVRAVEEMTQSLLSMV